MTGYARKQRQGVDKKCIDNKACFVKTTATKHHLETAHRSDGCASL